MVKRTDGGLFSWVDGWMRDLRLEFRALRREWLFTTFATTSLALGVGLAAAAYAVLHAVFLTDLPYAAPAELVRVSDTGSQQHRLTSHHLEQLARARSPFTVLAAFEPDQLSTSGPSGRVTDLVGARVSVNLFDVLGGVRPVAGRLLQREDSGLTDTLPIVVSERLVPLGLVSSEVGGTIDCGGFTCRVIGVAPASFWFPDRQTDYWAPLLDVPVAAVGTAVTTVSRQTIARLKSSVSERDAEAQASLILRAGQPARPLGPTLVAVESYESLLRAPLRLPLLVLQVASVSIAALVLLNLGCLFAARSRRRRDTWATMRALGASNRQVVRTELVGTGLVAMVSLPLALLVAALVLRYGLQLESGTLSRTASPTMSWHVAMVALAGVLLVTVAATLPSLAGLRAGTAVRSVRSVARGPLFAWWAMALQVAVVFAVGGQAIFFGQLIDRLATENVGLSKTDFVVLSARARSTTADSSTDRASRLAPMLRDLEASGVRAAVTNMLPLTPSYLRMQMGSVAVHRREWNAMVYLRIVTPAYFAISGMTPVQGRALTEADRGARRIIVNEAFASSVLAGRGTIGERVSMGAGLDWTVVGVTTGLRQADVSAERQAEAYVLFDDYLDQQLPVNTTQFHVLADGDRPPDVLMQQVGTAIGRHMPDVDIQAQRSMRELIDSNLGFRRLVFSASSLFALVAVLLVAVGLHGMVSEGLTARRREFGIRAALGGSPARISVEAVRPIAFIYLLGALLGGAVFLAGGAVLRNVIVPPSGVDYPTVPLILMSCSAGLVVVFVTACYRPVRAAYTASPASCLQSD